MSYQVLARKWRPGSFATMVGQDHVLRVLRHVLERQRLHHAYLFTGTRGVGKTTLARIFASCVNCEQGVSPAPCGECANCKELSRGCFPDLIEVDAASRAKVEETRELMDNAQYKPARGRYKVYLIDEVHMFSGHSFNALLKTLEEPPPYVLFLLATTEPKKIPVTILSRCMQFNLRHLDTAQIADQLRHILDKEAIPHDAGSITVLAHAAQGSMRDALSLLDQAISHGAGTLEESLVRQMMGTVEFAHLDALLSALVQGEGAQLLQAIDEMSSYGPDYFVLLAELLSLLQRAALVQLVPEQSAEVAADPLVRSLAEGLHPELVQLYYQIALKGYQDLRICPQPKAGFEMTLARMLAFRPASAQPRQQVADTASAGGNAGSEPPPDAATHRPAPSARDAASAPVAATTREADALERWRVLVEEMHQEQALSPLARQFAQRCRTLHWDAQSLRLGISAGHRHLSESRDAQAFLERLRSRLGDACNVELVVEEGTDTGETLQQRAVRRRQHAREDSLQKLREEPEVQALTKRFDARVDQDSLVVDKDVE